MALVEIDDNDLKEFREWQEEKKDKIERQEFESLTAKLHTALYNYYNRGETKFKDQKFREDYAPLIEAGAIRPMGYDFFIDYGKLREMYEEAHRSNKALGVKEGVGLFDRHGESYPLENAHNYVRRDLQNMGESIEILKKHLPEIEKIANAEGYDWRKDTSQGYAADMKAAIEEYDREYPENQEHLEETKQQCQENIEVAKQSIEKYKARAEERKKELEGILGVGSLVKVDDWHGYEFAESVSNDDYKNNEYLLGNLNEDLWYVSNCQREIAGMQDKMQKIDTKLLENGSKVEKVSASEISKTREENPKDFPPELEANTSYHNETEEERLKRLQEQNASHK